MNRNSPKRWKKLAAIPVVLLLLAFAAGCGDQKEGASASTASCAFVVGDGQNGRDSTIHAVVYPGQTVDLNTDSNGDYTEYAYYIPCNSRNYIINDGSVQNANGKQVGDRPTQSVGYTSSGVQIKGSITAYWTPNEGEAAMRKFYDVCFKYNCAKSEDVGGGVNFSSPGWNGMLGEIMGPALDAAFAKAAYEANDSVWQKHDPSEYDALAKKMSADFADIVRAKTGYSQDIFCGSGNSGWKNPDNPGQGDYTCTPVRIVVDKVERGTVDSTDGSTGAEKVNQQRLANATSLYGDDAAFWLALQDTITGCKNSHTTCVFNLGGANLPTVPATKTTP